MVAFSLLSLFLAAVTVAAPARSQSVSSCTVPKTAFSIPKSFTPITSPVLFTTVGIVAQYYTCSDGKIFFTGGSGLIIDISCLWDGPEFSKIQEDAFHIWSAFEGTDPTDPELLLQINKLYYYSPVLGIQYLRLDQSDQVVKTVFEFKSAANTTDQIAFIGRETKDVSSPGPNGSANIDWQQLQKEAGASANRVYRLETVGGGDAPELEVINSCLPTFDIPPLKYTAKFVFT